MRVEAEVQQTSNLAYLLRAGGFPFLATLAFLRSPRSNETHSG